MEKVRNQYVVLKYFWITALVLVVLSGSERKAAAQQPFSSVQVIGLLDKKVPEAEIKKQIEQYKVSFELTVENTRALLRAGASDELLRVIENNLYRELVITSPKNDAEAGSVIKVQGRSKKFSGKHLWVFAQRKGLSVWWPQGGEVDLDENGEWMQSAFIGQPQDVGFKFEIAAVWVTESIHKDMIDYLQSAEKSGRYPGIRLPDGVPAVRVTVRKTTP
jgi:hypothetical protein